MLPPNELYSGFSGSPLGDPMRDGGMDLTKSLESLNPRVPEPVSIRRTGTETGCLRGLPGLQKFKSLFTP
jgi:hypothetical protein